MVQRVGVIPRDRSGETHFIWIDPLTGRPIKGSTSVEPAEDNAYELKSDLQLMTRMNLVTHQPSNPINCLIYLFRYSKVRTNVKCY